MGNGSGVSRGDRNRSARLERLRGLVPVTNAIVGIDLADKKQMVVVTDHDSKVLARKTFRCRAWDLGAALDWAIAGDLTPAVRPTPPARLFASATREHASMVDRLRYRTDGSGDSRCSSSRGSKNLKPRICAPLMCGTAVLVWMPNMKSGKACEYISHLRCRSARAG
ncbi:MAG: transposase [Pseudonocardiales bacterium]|nr:transposase [Pseudonocardiales bacterium]